MGTVKGKQVQSGMVKVKMKPGGGRGIKKGNREQGTGKSRKRGKDGIED
jgi:hypothetical protein